MASHSYFQPLRHSHLAATQVNYELPDLPAVLFVQQRKVSKHTAGHVLVVDRLKLQVQDVFIPIGISHQLQEIRLSLQGLAEIARQILHFFNVKPQQLVAQGQ